MIIKPYSDIAAEAFNAADFPALKHFWACKQPDMPVGIAPGYLLDVVGGASFIPSGGVTTVTPTSIEAAAATGLATAAPLTTPGLASCILIACGTWGGTSNGFLYGSPTGTAGVGGINVGNASTGAKASDGTNVVTVAGGAPTQSAGAFTRVVTLDATQIMNFETSSSALEANPYANVTARGTTGAIDVVGDTVGFPTTAVTFNGIAFFKFAGALPPQEQIMAAAAWCDYQWRNNANVCMYPGFKGLA